MNPPTLRTPAVGPTLDYLAAAVVTVAIFALPFAFMRLTTGHRSLWFVAGFALACLVVGVAVFRLAAGPAWPSMLAAIIAAGAVTWLGGVIAFFVGYGIEIDNSLCGHAPATIVAYIGALVAYALVGGWALTAPGGPRFFLGPSAGAALGIAWALISLAVLPGGHGYCET
jgi:hypothetical protein